jgi:hypothetical protein
MISSKGAGFAGILQALARLERVSTPSAFAKMRARPVFSGLRPMSKAMAASLDQCRAGVAAFLAADFFVTRFG